LWKMSLGNRMIWLTISTLLRGSKYLSLFLLQGLRALQSQQELTFDKVKLINHSSIKVSSSSITLLLIDKLVGLESLVYLVG